MNQELTVFNFEDNNIRTVMVDGDPWFVGKDVAGVLGYKNTNETLKLHCRGVEKRYPIIDNIGRTQEARIINEPDMLRLIVKSQLPSAVKFEAWVFEEVLPQIRKTGKYSIKPQFQLPQNYEEALEHLLVKVKENSLLQEKIEEDAPKVKFHDAIEVAENSIPIGVFSKIIDRKGLGPNKMFQWFRSSGYLIDGGRRHNTPHQRWVTQGLLEVRESTIMKPSGESMIVYTTLVTGKGQTYFEKKLREEF